MSSYCGLFSYTSPDGNNNPITVPIPTQPDTDYVFLLTVEVPEGLTDDNPNGLPAPTIAKFTDHVSVQFVASDSNENPIVQGDTYIFNWALLRPGPGGEANWP